MKIKSLVCILLATTIFACSANENYPLPDNGNNNQEQTPPTNDEGNNGNNNDNNGGGDDNNDNVQRPLSDAFIHITTNGK